MCERPRRRRANAWAWLYLTLFVDGDVSTDAGTESIDQAGGSTLETSDEPERR